MTYSSADAAFADADAKAELAKTLLARVQPIANTPAELYSVKTRKIPAGTVAACAGLGYLPGPIEGRHVTDHALVSLLRDAAGEVCGLQLEFHDILGARTAVEPSKQSYSLRPGGCRDGLFCAGGEGDVAYLTEGNSCKALAVASLGIGKVYGGGGLNVLGFAVPPERRVVLVPDKRPEPTAWSADGAEKLLDQHAAAYARAVDRLILAGREVAIAAEPDCQCCKDADAFLRKHGAIRLKELLQRTVPGELSRQGQIKRLARIRNELDRAAEIKKACETLETLHGVPIRQVREAVEAERTKAQAALAPKPKDAEPWDKPVELGPILNELVAELGRYIATPRTNLYAAALWCAMSHVYDRLYCAPKLALQSPTPGAGKTTLLDCLSNVVRQPEPVSGVSASAFIRMSDAVQPTWLLDEADRVLNPKNASEELTAALNASSYRRMARIIISVPNPSGGWEQQAFHFWCPMILSGIKRLVDTVQDRSIVLAMQRARPGELKHRLINGTSFKFQEIQRKLLRWAADLSELDLDPVVPSFLHNREADLWRPLFALAELAGGRWPQRAEVAARAIHGQRTEDSARLVELLEAIRDEFSTEERLQTSDLIGRLISRSDEPWATINRGKPISAYTLRTMLAGIVKRDKAQVRVGKHVWRGYRRSDFTEAWARYLVPAYTSEPGNPSATSATSATASKTPAQEPVPERSGSKEASATDLLQPGGSGCVADGVADPLHGQAVGNAAENGAVADVADVADQNEAPGGYTSGNGLDPDTEAAVVASEIRDGYRCAACACAFTAEHGSELDEAGRYVHRGGCSEQPPPPKKSRIRRSRIKRPGRSA
jgi:hypothetical protein